ncbi:MULTISPECIES: DUF3090 domain-containing protein [Dermacoccus]|jgi:uncharacterized repeat protein (TIGR03847 family)|uniref:DUF3090 domain-containing protein n=2 Tax=Dermacoccus TaxID=57495 RepID=A0A417ZA21_9MICO|nr:MULTISPECIES: DUF3090 domain-containing protein [Dermacoccus]MBE7372431.1 DUF3090 domain-containing protein [Dermacoccus barathri]MBZ4496478.1 DUF3090 domain-containing protein [Dermacoccus sp. Tok2021]MCT1987469.1 DUF3090 domain-containing protein [Dermacoccus abyssi]RHW47484.1 DUF3090 domain-containing protein [Dermacoccus abyssi]RYI23750.1 DUF3090 domain-containing protein [Dermacoccus sp. 147Ba]
MPVLEFVHPQRFVAGTVGEPGAREFYLQVRDPRRVEGVAIEKQQVELLAERVAELLDEVGADRDVPAAPQDNDPLELPVDPIFRVGSMSAAWNPTTQLLSIECHDLEHEVGASDETDGEQTTLRVVMTPSVAREFSRRSIALVAQGRRPCPLCNEPLDPSGHVCPRANGYRRR